MRIESALDPAIPTLRGDISKLMRAVLNLLTNALKFTDQGVVMLSAHLVRSAAGVATVRLEVVDTGVGMTDDQIADATEPYVHAPVEDHGGMGLGLAIVSRAITSLGGSLAISSAGMGMGTRCSFTIDVEEVAPPGFDDAVLSAPEAVQRVMIVDDVEVVLSGARQIVTSLGHNVVHTATDGEEALRILTTRTDDIDVVFMDIRLPKVFGDAAVAQFRAWEREHRRHKKPLRIYATSGDASQSMLQALEKTGFDGTLAKPVYPASYRQVLSLKASGSAADGSLLPGGGAGGAGGGGGGGGAAAAPDEAALARQMSSRLPKTVINCADMISELGFSVDLAVQLLETAKKYLVKQRTALHDAAALDGWGGEDAADGAGVAPPSTTSVGGIAHSVKGAVEQIFATRLSIASRTLMEHANAGERAHARAALLVWDQELEKLLTALSTQTYEVLFERTVHDHGKAEFWATHSSPSLHPPAPPAVSGQALADKRASGGAVTPLAPDAGKVVTLQWVKRALARQQGEQQEIIDQIDAQLGAAN